MNLSPEQESFVEHIKLGSGYDEAIALSGCTCAKAGVYYVYMLIDPDGDSIFYVGKGKGKRVQSHAKNAKALKIDNAEKHKAITAIHERGEKVKERVFFRTDNEHEAYAIERALIQELKHCGLTNIAKGVKTNAELDLERAKALRCKVAPLEWLRANPDKDIIKVWGGMSEFHAWMHSTIDLLISEAERKLRGEYA